VKEKSTDDRNVQTQKLRLRRTGAAEQKDNMKKE
jgi:hypothetical protein